MAVRMEESVDGRMFELRKRDNIDYNWKKSEQQKVSCLTHFCTSGMKTSLFNLFSRTALWKSLNNWGGTMTSTVMFRPLTPVQNFNFQQEQHRQTWEKQRSKSLWLKRLFSCFLGHLQILQTSTFLLLWTQMCFKTSVVPYLDWSLF